MRVTEIGIKTNYMVLKGFLRGKKDKPLKEKEVRTVLKLLRESIASANGHGAKQANACHLEQRERLKVYAFSIEPGAPRTVLGRVPSFRFEL